ncbi:MAG: TIGR02444 family protein [Chromatocurvus sp.]
MAEYMAVPALWEEMLDLYAAPGMSEACVAVQDACDADVLLLLCAALLARRGLQLTPDIAEQLVAETRDWRREVIVPLRALRRRWREQPAAGDLRERLKALELDAERSEVDMLQRMLDAASLQSQSQPLGAAALLRANCAAACPVVQRPTACQDTLREFCDTVAAFLWPAPRGS